MYINWRRSAGTMAMTIMVFMCVTKTLADADGKDSPSPAMSSSEEFIGDGGSDETNEPLKPFFWFNEITGESAWDLPVIEEIDKQTGTLFYYDTSAKEATWVRKNGANARTRKHTPTHKHACMHARARGEPWPWEEEEGREEQMK